MPSGSPDPRPILLDIKRELGLSEAVPFSLSVSVAAPKLVLSQGARRRALCWRAVRNAVAVAAAIGAHCPAVVEPKTADPPANPDARYVGGYLAFGPEPRNARETGRLSSNNLCPDIETTEITVLTRAAPQDAALLPTCRPAVRPKNTRRRKGSNRRNSETRGAGRGALAAAHRRPGRS